MNIITLCTKNHKEHSKGFALAKPVIIIALVVIIIISFLLINKTKFCTEHKGYLGLCRGGELITKICEKWH